MTVAELRAAQTPLKQQYREHPASALVTLHAKGEAADNFRCRVETHIGPVDAGLHPATGGDGREACSGDMLLQALVACAGVTLSAVAGAMGIHIRRATLTAEGELDFRGTLGVAKEAPVGFTKILLWIALDSDATEEQGTKLLELTERYCVVYQTLRAGVTVETAFR